MSEHDNSAPKVIAPERRLRRAVVRSGEILTPHMKRITIQIDDLADFAVDSQGQWIKLFLPRMEGKTLVGRAYTIRAFREDSGEIDVDFVLHAHGVFSAWVEHVRVGDPIDIAGPRAGFRLSSDTRHLLLGGDETALPAIASIIEAVPAGIKIDAFIEIPDIQDEQLIETKAELSLNWLPRHGAAVGARDALSTSMIGADFPDADSEVWFAAEATPVRIVRRHFLVDRGLPATRVTVSGYWKHGEVDFRDSTDTA